jgi:rubrerythrin
MSQTGDAVLDPRLFAEGPRRDPRFVVKDRWVECANFPGDDPRHMLEFFNRQMNEEVNGLESSAQSLHDFRDADWELRMWLARQCADEARHVAMFRMILEKRGGRVGCYPVLNFQFRIITKVDNLIGRLAIQNRSFEAGGIDAIAFGIGEARKQGDHELAELYEAQIADEIVHVRFANDWIERLAKRQPRNLLRIAEALAKAEKAFHQVMGAEGTQGVSYPADWQGRLEAGFKSAEIAAADQLAGTAQAAAEPR